MTYPTRDNVTRAGKRFVKGFTCIEKYGRYIQTPV